MGYTRHRLLPLVPRNYRNHRPHVRLPLSHSLLETFSQATPQTTRPPATAIETYTLYGYSTLDTTPKQLANFLLVLAKTTIYKTYLATNSTHRHMPDYQCMFHMRLQYQLYTEMHYSLWANDMDTYRGYWLHGNILGKIHDGKIILSDKI
jgi:hypothetical protein